jgi:short-subunit dehydrogenase
MTVCPGYIATNFDKNKTPGRQPRRLNEGNRIGADLNIVARDTLNGYLKGRREVYTPWYYWFFAKLYGLVPGLIEWGITRRL